MKKEEIHIWDIKRILFGDAPPEFMLEVFIRSVVVYLVAIMVVRWMGKRMNGQHTIIELAVMVMMGAIISLPMQAPDRGILQGVLVLLITLLLLRGINWLGFKNSRIERTTQGELFVLVKNGVLQKDVQKKTAITNQQVFEVLRSRQIYNLGTVKRMYIEACGIFSVYREEKGKPGLPIYPQIDKTVYESYESVSPGEKACSNCGLIQPSAAASCPNCKKDNWVKAIQ
ncbi:MAG TPA: YetF domain-containing protein [Flavisolibacter sp.]|jgi:uncharacterized membrane protein YcaP (DUF421 family)|nr:YetF domain-containing protein [Flavisolibacter sp.]